MSNKPSNVPARPASAASVFALLDDCRSGLASHGERVASRLYTGFVREHRCTDPATLDRTWAAVQADQRAGLQAVLVADYEWGAKLLHAGDAHLSPTSDSSSLLVLMFEHCAHLCPSDVDAWLQAQDEGLEAPSVAGAMKVQASVDESAFIQAVEAIHAAIRAGETYQINYTYRLHAQAFGTPVALYRRLRARQPVAFGAFLALPSGPITHVLSLSPELFLRHERGLLTARPMKGTAARRPVPESDREAARLLSLDIKNRAENLMIVDLLRNDLGRISRIGSVRVPALFAIEPYATVFQMTSTVQAELRPDIDMPTLLRAVFPCGSITGAPKHHTMSLIADLESTPRGIYCGAIGWIDAPPPSTASDAPGPVVGDFCWSVAIRTLTLKAPLAGLRPMALGVGAGIVLDSVAHDEFQECRLKARFFTGMDPGFALFETMRHEPGQGLLYRAAHLERLQQSAQVLGFAFDPHAIEAALQAAQPAMAPDGPSRVRLNLTHDGRCTVVHAPLAPLVLGAGGTVSLRLAPQRLPMNAPLAAHKTTLRQHYDEAVQAAEAVGAFDSIFLNTEGQVVEGGRSTIFVQREGRWQTPPLRVGVLPGIMRARVLADPRWQAQEAELSLDDLRTADGLMVCNALRGILPARWRGDEPSRAPATF